MLSKILPWDLVARHPNVLDSGSKSGIYALLCPDPFIEQLLLIRIKRYLRGHASIKITIGNEVNSSWCDNVFWAQDLFGDCEHQIILLAASIPQHTHQKILTEITPDDRRILLWVFEKPCPLFEALSNDQKVRAIRVDPPPFWMTARLLDFLCVELGLTLDSDAKSFILAAIPPTSGDLLHALYLIKTHWPEQHPSLEGLRSLLSHSKVDQFQMATLFSKKNWRQLFREMLQSDSHNPDMWVQFSAFMEGHLLKLADPSYLGQKKTPNKPNRYDKEIMDYTKKWNKDDLTQWIQFFGSLALDSKRHNPFLKEKIRLKLCDL